MLFPKKSINILSGLFLASLFFISGCKTETKPKVEGDRVREYAGDLVNRSLFTEAIEQYQTYLKDYEIEDRERANVNYIIANTFFDRVRNYEKALAFYLKIKHFYPESSLMEEVNKKIVACLERLDKPEDAKQALDEAVQMDPTQVKQSRPGAVVAKIDKREITVGDLNFEISQLPPSVRDQFRTREKKLQFLREYVATELLYDTAKRAGLDREQAIVEGAFQAKKSLMVRKLLEDRVAGKVNIEEEDLQLYFDANKETYSEKDDDGNIVNEKSLADVREQVYNDYGRQKYQNAYQALIERMLMAENVRFFESRVE
jgi:tetratricopeptide (TPR) repeat protein